MSQENTLSLADRQLSAIAGLVRVLESRGIDFWLFGGWAVDFWAGEVTREHDDIDVAAWRADYHSIQVALTTAGWRHAPVADEVIGTRYELASAMVEFTFVTRSADGHIVLPMPEQPIVWSTQPFGNDWRELGDVRCRVLPLALLKAGKASPREGVVEAAKDRADSQALARLP